MATDDLQPSAGHQAITPSLVVKGAAAAIEFYKEVFGAVEATARLVDPKGNILHTELIIGNSRISLSDENPDFGSLSPETIGGSSVRLALNVDDPDSVAEHAVLLGATIEMPIADQFYGERSGRLVDPYGHVWVLEKHIEDVSPDEMQKRANKMFGVK